MAAIFVGSRYKYIINTLMDRLLSLNKVRPTKKVDSVKESKLRGNKRAFDVLMQAQQYWFNMHTFRATRERNKRYAFGDQWKDYVVVDGETMTEEAYIKMQGNIPLKNNLIHRLIRNVMGVYRGQMKEPTCVARDRDEQQLGETMSVILQCNNQVNRRNEIDARTFQDFLIGGLAVHRKWYGWRNDKLDCWTDYVNPNNFFIDNNMRDFRGWDVSCVGEIHDITFESLCSQFAETPQDYIRLKEMYSRAHDKDAISLVYQEFGKSEANNLDFLYTNNPSLFRVIEVWRKESKARYICHDYNNGDVYKIDIEDYDQMVAKVNQDRIRRGREAGMTIEDIPLIQATWKIDDYWYYYYLTPFGDILKEGETPYDHKSHPYVFKAYPFIDGEIHAFVADVIDQQRYTNRLITLYDWIMRASAKGVLLFPEECLPTNMNIEDIADEWSRFNGVIAIKTKGTAALPQQVSNNATNIGISELLNMQLKFFEDISGVNGALQGKTGYAGTSAKLYQQQTQNSTTSLLDLLDSFSMFIIDGAYKDVKNMQQFYDTKRVFNIAGKNSLIEYDPNKIRDVEFDLSIVESTSTPAYRDMANDLLKEIWASGQISLEQFLQHGNFPFADELLQSIKSQKEQVEQGQMPEGVSPELMAQVQQGANPQAMALAQRWAA